MTEISKLYGDKVILAFDPKFHVYTVTDSASKFKEVSVYGVTSICGVMAKPALMYWAVNQSIEFIGASLKPGEALDELQIKQMLEGARKAHTETKGKAADIGTMIHEWIEDYLKKGLAKQPLPALPINPEMRNSIQSFLAWAKEHKVKFLESEKKIYSRKYCYAGTCDAVAMVDGKLSVVDFKTSKALYDEYFLQASAYHQALSEEFGTKYNGGVWLIRLTKEQEEVAPFEAKMATDIQRHFRAFLGLKEAYAWQVENKRMSAIKRFNGEVPKLTKSNAKTINNSKRRAVKVRRRIQRQTVGVK